MNDTGSCHLANFWIHIILSSTNSVTFLFTSQTCITDRVYPGSRPDQTYTDPEYPRTRPREEREHRIDILSTPLILDVDFERCLYIGTVGRDKFRRHSGSEFAKSEAVVLRILRPSPPKLIGPFLIAQSSVQPQRLPSPLPPDIPERQFQFAVITGWPSKLQVHAEALRCQQHDS